MSVVTFKTLADMDLEAAYHLLQASTLKYNMAASHARQSVEKNLKYLLAMSATDDNMKLKMDEIQKLLQTHNLSKIMWSCMDVHTELYRLKQDVLGIAGIYFSSNYPGGEYVPVTKEQAQEYYDVAMKVRELCTNLLKAKV